MRRALYVRRLVTALATSAMVLTACGGGGGESASTPASSLSTPRSGSDTRNSDQLARDTDAAQSVLLQLSDFPSGWEAKARKPPSEESPAQKAAVTKFAQCLGVDPGLVGDESNTDKAEARSDTFADSRDLEVEEDVTVEANGDQGSAVMDAFRKPEARGCFQEFFGAALEDVLAHPEPGKELPSGASVGSVEVGDLNLTGVSGDPVVYRVTIPVSVGQITIKVYVDILFAFDGRTGLFVTFQNVGDPFPTDLETQLANTTLERVPQ